MGRRTRHHAMDLAPRRLIRSAAALGLGLGPSACNDLDIQGDFNEAPAYEALLGRLEAGTMPPTYYCDLGDGAVISDEDLRRLVDWLTAGAPDAPAWAEG